MKLSLRSFAVLIFNWDEAVMTVNKLKSPIITATFSGISLLLFFGISLVKTAIGVGVGLGVGVAETLATGAGTAITFAAWV
jgi:hypothetical protein